LRCTQCGASLSVPKDEAQPAPIERKPARKASPIGIGLIAVVGVLFVIACVVFIVLSGRTEGHNALVQSASWMTSIAIESLGPVAHQGWVDEIPIDAEVGQCTPKVHHIQDDPAPNSNKVCGTPYSVDKGSGYAEVVQDCQYEVYLDYCEYTVMEWYEIDRLSLDGVDYSPMWPDPQLAGDQRLGEKEAVYKVVFETKDGQYTYTTHNFEEYQMLQIGSEWILNINTFGQVMSVESEN
jgi:hypothetical protein